MGFRTVALAVLLVIGAAAALEVRSDELDQYTNGERHYFPQQFDEDRFLEQSPSSSSEGTMPGYTMS